MSKPTDRQLIQHILGEIRLLLINYEVKTQGKERLSLMKIGDWEILFLLEPAGTDAQMVLCIYDGKDKAMNYYAPLYDTAVEFNYHIVRDWLKALKLCPCCGDMPTILNICNLCFLKNRDELTKIVDCDICASAQIGKYIYHPECCSKDGGKNMCGDCLSDEQKLPNMACPFCRNEEEFRTSRRHFLDLWNLD